VADHLHLGGAGGRVLLVRLQHLVDDRVELLVGRLPRFEQVVVDVDDVDRRDGRVGVGVGGEQGAAGAREQVHGLLQELDPGDLGHAVVGEQHRHLAAAQLGLPQHLHRLRRRRRPHDPVRLAVAAPQVAGDRARHRGVVVDGEQDGPGGGLGGRGHGWE
jgi:hypothetical protein